MRNCSPPGRCCLRLARPARAILTCVQAAVDAAEDVKAALCAQVEGLTVQVTEVGARAGCLPTLAHGMSAFLTTRCPHMPSRCCPMGTAPSRPHSLQARAMCSAVAAQGQRRRQASEAATMAAEDTVGHALAVVAALEARLGRATTHGDATARNLATAEQRVAALAAQLAAEGGVVVGVGAGAGAGAGAGRAVGGSPALRQLRAGAVSEVEALMGAACAAEARAEALRAERDVLAAQLQVRCRACPAPALSLSATTRACGPLAVCRRPAGRARRRLTGAPPPRSPSA